MVVKRKHAETADWQPERRRFSTDEYERMIEAGVFQRPERIELIEGEILCMAAIGTRHWRAVNLFAEFLLPPLVGRAIVSIQSSIRLSEGSEPEPDVAVLRRPHDYYLGRLPGPSDVLLLIEVADTTLPYDRQRKLPLYAAAGILETWLFDLEHERATLHREPAADGYRSVTTVERGGRLSPLAFPDIVLAVDDVLGPPAEQAR